MTILTGSVRPAQGHEVDVELTDLPKLWHRTHPGDELDFHADEIACIGARGFLRRPPRAGREG
jgi:hypothetical protein